MEKLTREMYEILYCYTEGIESEIGWRTGFSAGDILKTEGLLIQKGLLEISKSGSVEVTVEGVKAVLRGLIKQICFFSGKLKQP